MAKRLKPDKLWFVDRIAEVGLSRRKVALSIPLDPSSFGRTLTGDRRVQIDEAIAISQILGARIDRVLERFGFSGVERVVPIVGTVGADGQVSKPNAKLGDTPSPPDLPPGAIALLCQTANSPLSMWDECLFYSTTQDTVTADDVGRLCVIQTTDAIVIGSLSRGSARGRYKVTVLGTGVTTQPKAVVSASPVLWIRSP